METVYTFPNGFSEQATGIYAHLKYCGLNPHWRFGEDNAVKIDLPAGEIPCLRMMQHNNQARFGHAPEE